MSELPIPGLRASLDRASAGTYAAVFGPLDLAGIVPLGKGADRRVFQHPHVPSLLVKVIDVQAHAAYLGRRRYRRWYRRYQREGSYRGYISELAEYVTTFGGRAGHPWRLPVARVLGLAQTSAGLGLLVEKIAADDGGTAPTLAQVVAAEGFDAALRRRLDEFFDTLIEAHVVLNDISPRNIAVGRNAEGVQGLYLIDGFGVKQAIPLYSWSKALNGRHIRLRYAELRVKLDHLAADGKVQAALGSAPGGAMPPGGRMPAEPARRER